MGLRIVEVMKWDRVTRDGRTFSEKVCRGNFVFHGFGVHYEEFEAGPGNFTTAIIEDKSGQLDFVEVSLVRFLEPTASVDSLA